MCRKMLHPHGFRCSTFFDLAQHPSQEQPSAPISNGLAPVSTATVQAPPTPSPVPQPGQTFPTTPAPGASSPMLLPAQPPSQQPQFPPGVALNNADHAKQAQVAPGARPPSTSAPGLPSQMQQRANAFPGSLSDFVMSFENVKQKGMCLGSSQTTFKLTGWVVTCFSAPHRMSNLDQVHKLLQGSYTSMPQPQDTEKSVPTSDCTLIRLTDWSHPI